MKTYQPLDFSGLNTYSIHGRYSKVTVENFAKPLAPGSTLKEFIASLPEQLLGLDFPELVGRLAASHENGRPIVVGMGAHVIKVGLNPILIDLMERGIISAIALNGAGIVHDTEIAMVGRTSEEVGDVLGSGAFGAAKETGEVVNAGINLGAEKGLGLGEGLGEYLLARDFPYNNMSLLATAKRLGIPLTVHVAMGTDIVHIHPTANGAAIGQTSHQDFRLFCGLVAELEGGAYLNFGSAVLLPEVFLKALTVARNLGHVVNNFTTANFDFIRHYRTMTNVVNRPTMGGGKGYNIIGHHELLIPLLAATLLDRLHGK
ncbi:MAG: GSU2086 family protein [Desulfobulbia bacterium]